MYKTVRGLVLREVRYKDADKILTVLTEEDGKLTVRARGALRRSSRIAAGAQLLVYSEMTLFGNRGRWILEEAQTLELFSGIRSDIELLALGVYLAELLETISDTDEQGSELLRLGLNSLYALSHDLYPREQIKAAFELRAMCLAGFEPQLAACPVCGREHIAEPVLELSAGSISCAGCTQQLAAGKATLCPDSLSAARYIVSAPLKKLFSFAISEQACSRLSDAAERYVLEQLERRFASLDYYRSLMTFRG